jgi:hypothetical protein
MYCYLHKTNLKEKIASGISIKIFCAFFVSSMCAICSVWHILLYFSIVKVSAAVYIIKLFVKQVSPVFYYFLSPTSENCSQRSFSDILSLWSQLKVRYLVLYPLKATCKITFEMLHQFYTSLKFHADTKQKKALRFSPIINYDFVGERKKSELKQQNFRI